ncbi:MAG TPA: dihydrofolate reductase family protein [Casimicrobiaceae bacterium]|jgi:riboflavin biosynthesis pyrimidine reductase
MSGRAARAEALETLREARQGALLPLPRRLARRYGPLRLPSPRTRPFVYSNFVTSLDGVVSFNVKGHASGGDISGFSAQDRMVMGLLRAVADAVVIGSGTLDADRRHVWTAEAIYPPLAREFRQLRAALGMPAAPRCVIVTGSGDIDLDVPLFTSGTMPVLIVTTTAGASRLRAQAVPASVSIRAVRRGSGAIAARTILDEVCRATVRQRVLVEGGPRLLGDFYAERLVDEQFLTLAPQIVGRARDDRRFSLVMGQLFAPGNGRWATLHDVRRGGDLLFLRYAFARVARATRRG